MKLTNMKLLDWTPLFVASALLVLVGSMQVSADDDRDSDDDKGREHGEMKGHDKGPGMPANNESWKTECSACHMAYPPKMLPADSWAAVMGGLGDHFGSDASLDEATLKEISGFLQANAGRTRGQPPATPVLRITDTRWFKHEHDEISPLTWKRASIQSASNCTACHTQAEKGNFDEDWVKIPR